MLPMTFIDNLPLIIHHYPTLSFWLVYVWPPYSLQCVLSTRRAFRFPVAWACLSRPDLRDHTGPK